MQCTLNTYVTAIHLNVVIDCASLRIQDPTTNFPSYIHESKSTVMLLSNATTAKY